MNDEQKYVLDLIARAKRALDDPIVRHYAGRLYESDLERGLDGLREAEKQLLKEMKKN